MSFCKGQEHAIVRIWQSGNNFWEIVPSFQCVYLEFNHVVRVGSKHLYLMSHLARTRNVVEYRYTEILLWLIVFKCHKSLF